jgi:hypothetical protein
VKPNKAGSSFGISKVKPTELPIAMKWLIKKTTKSSSVFLDGTRRWVRNKGSRALRKSFPETEFFDYKPNTLKPSRKNYPPNLGKRWLKSRKYDAYELLK